jgi:hypothetical protein
LGDRATFFPITDKIHEAINIEDSDSDIDYDNFEVNLDTGDKKKKYKRVYDSLYKIPPP